MPSQKSLSLDGSFDAQNGDEEGKCLWSAILKEVTHKASFKLSSTRALLVLGDDESGKTTLIAKLQGTEDPKETFGLEYSFIEIKDEDRDDQTKLNVWILNGQVAHDRLLKFALNADNFGDSVVMIVVSMAEPWKLMECLDKWVTILESHIETLSIPMETLAEYRNGLVRGFREYVEPDALLPATPAPIQHTPLATAPIHSRRLTTQGLHPATAALLSSTLADQQPNKLPAVIENGGSTSGDQPVVPELPLDQTTLSHNLGIPMVVVVTKTDVMDTLEKEDRYTDEHFDFIQMHIRRFCLKYGAALFYVSVKENKHCDLLSRYLQSRIYGFPFTQAPYVVERDCVFVPAGWDSEKKIAILEENFTRIRSTDPYNTVVPHPPPRKAAVRDPEVVAQDEQSFLTRLITMIQREPAVGVNTGITASSDPILGHLGSQGGAGNPSIGQPTGNASPRAQPRSKPTPPSAGSNTGDPAIGTGPNPRASEGVLANFFTSLLNKRSNFAGAGSAAAVPGTDKLNMSSKDMQSELERFANSSREALGTNKPRIPSQPAADGALPNDPNGLEAPAPTAPTNG
ncbi:unnamed protein product [Dicrocoelium dendriticum]|nr:unnamed protein product [Dicrocoelium dendriticum]